MIWLASFPRSGNTFARNVLFDVYGLESTEVNQKVFRHSSTYQEFPVVKTHLLPADMEHIDEEDIVIYLVRDGRDALVSIAHHRSNIVEPGSDVQENLRLAVEAQKGSYFGGWDRNAAEWVSRADLVIRFEDLIKDPVAEIEKLRRIKPDLPTPDLSSIPTFESQKKGDSKYGPPRKKGLFFRKGEVGDWKNTMNDEVEKIFWDKCGDVMMLLGYDRSGKVGNFKWNESTRKKAGRLARKRRSILEKLSRTLGGGPDFISYPRDRPNLKPKLIYLNAIQVEDPFLTLIRQNVADEKIIRLVLNGDGTLEYRQIDGKKVADSETAEVLISEVSMPYLHQAALFTGEPLVASGLMEPIEHVTSMFFREYEERPLRELTGDEAFIRFCRRFEQRNTQSRVISKFTKELDVVWTPENYTQRTGDLVGQLGWSFEDHSFEKIDMPADLINEVSRYNRRDIDMYQFYNQKLRVHAEDQA